MRMTLCGLVVVVIFVIGLGWVEANVKPSGVSGDRGEQ